MTQSNLGIYAASVPESHEIDYARILSCHE